MHTLYNAAAEKFGLKENIKEYSWWTEDGFKVDDNELLQCDEIRKSILSLRRNELDKEKATVKENSTPILNDTVNHQSEIKETEKSKIIIKMCNFPCVCLGCQVILLNDIHFFFTLKK